MNLLKMGCVTIIAGFLVMSGIAQQEKATKAPDGEKGDTKKDTKKESEEVRKEQPKLDENEKNEIKKWSKEKLVAAMAKAQNTLSREGQNKLKLKVRLEVFVVKEKAVYDELKKDPKIADVEEKLKDAKPEFKKLLTAKDDKELQSEFEKILGKLELKRKEIDKYKDYKEAELNIKTAEEGLERIAKIFDKPIDFPAAVRRRGKSSTKSQIDAIVSGIPDESGAVIKKPENETDATDLRKLLEALAR